MQVGRDLLAPLDQKVISDQLASLDCKAHLADKEMLERQELLEHKVPGDSQDSRVPLVSLETWVPQVLLDGLVHQDLKDKLDNSVHKVVECCIDVIILDALFSK